MDQSAETPRHYLGLVFSFHPENHAQPEVNILRYKLVKSVKGGGNQKFTCNNEWRDKKEPQFEQQQFHGCNYTYY